MNMDGADNMPAAFCTLRHHTIFLPRRTCHADNICLLPMLLCCCLEGTFLCQPTFSFISLLCLQCYGRRWRSGMPFPWYASLLHMLYWPWGSWAWADEALLWRKLHELVSALGYVLTLPCSVYIPGVLHATDLLALVPAGSCWSVLTAFPYTSMHGERIEFSVLQKPSHCMVGTTYNCCLSYNIPPA